MHSCGVAERPCPRVECRQNLTLQERQPRGRPPQAPRDTSESCVLDVVCEHPDGLTLSEVGRKIGVVREMVRKIEVRAVRKLAVAGG